jgi:hypothetical protein
MSNTRPVQDCAYVRAQRSVASATVSECRPMTKSEQYTPWSERFRMRMYFCRTFTRNSDKAETGKLPAFSGQWLAYESPASAYNYFAFYPHCLTPITSDNYFPKAHRPVGSFNGEAACPLQTLSACKGSGGRCTPRKRAQVCRHP